jgi:ketosteroid isomerase-like protein
MSGPVDTVRAMFDAVAVDDAESALACLHPQVRMHTSELEMPDLADRYDGLDGVAAFWLAWNSAWKSVRFDPLEFREKGDLVFAWLTASVEGRSTGLSLTLPAYGVVYRVDGGLIREITFFRDRPSALAAAQLPSE